MADGKPPRPPLSPHEEGENTNTNPIIPKLTLQPRPFIKVDGGHSSIQTSMVPVSGSQSVTSQAIPQASDANHVLDGSFHKNKAPTSNQTLFADVVKGLRSSTPLKPVNVEANQQHRSFSQVVQGFNRPIQLMEPHQELDLEYFLKPINIVQGKHTVLFPLSEKNVLVDKLKLVLVGKFSHGMPSLNIIRNFFTAMKLQRSCTVSFFDRKHIFIECFCKNDYDFLWLRLAWVIEGYTMRVLKWSDDFNPTKESAIVPVWVRLEGLPLYLFDEMSLLSIGNSVGKPIKVDPRNVNRSIVNSARICVELDVSKPLLDSVWVSFEDDVTKVVLEEFRIKVFYDEVPPYCDFCCHIGHGLHSCKRREENVSHIELQTGSAVLMRGAGLSATWETVAEGIAARGNAGTSRYQTAAAPDTGRPWSAGADSLGTAVQVNQGTHLKLKGSSMLEPQGKMDQTAAHNCGGHSKPELQHNLVHRYVPADILTFGQVDSYGKGMNQVEGMLLQPFLQASQPDLQTTTQKQAHEISTAANIDQVQRQNKEVVLVEDVTLEEEELAPADLSTTAVAVYRVEASSSFVNVVDAGSAAGMSVASAMAVTSAKTAGSVRKPDVPVERGAVAYVAGAAGFSAAGQTVCEGLVTRVPGCQGVDVGLASGHTFVEHISADMVRQKTEHIMKEQNAILSEQVEGTRGREQLDDMLFKDSRVVLGEGSAITGGQVVMDTTGEKDAYTMFIERMQRLRDMSSSFYTFRSLSPVGRSSEKLSKLRKRVEHLKVEEGTALELDKERYKELDDLLNENLLQQITASKEQRKASSTKDSTEIVSREMKADALQEDEKDWTTAQRRGRNRNRKK